MPVIQLQKGIVLIENCHSSRSSSAFPANCNSFLPVYTFKLKEQAGESFLDSPELQATPDKQKEVEYLAETPPVDCQSPASMPGQRISVSWLCSTSVFNCSHLWMALGQQDASLVFLGSFCLGSFCLPKLASFRLRIRSIGDQKGVFLTRDSVC